MGTCEELAGGAQPAGTPRPAATAAPPADELRWRFDPAADRRATGELCKSLSAALVAAPWARTVVCDVTAVRTPTLATVNVLARLRLTARRLGRGFQLDGVQPRLALVLELTGLAGVLDADGAPAGPVAAGSALQEGREAEQREQPVGVQEVVDPDDLSF
ncbi:STAS domain-containing protein [Pseudofrankia sp. BMG5.36]|uniref:STAS domain-containing protein n=1 Tax=Pseudofrankia sp. BMG5.36 TaxID=1834512 RepID=UPI0008D90C99|nr:STAS domain-containing protein [Pseudofrankia sp. BMG5.36]OHV42453.1 hypothetical protein BCD48_31185 [Pseudofrankia sp. BMG5.36]